MHPRLKRTIEPIETPDGDLVLMRSAADDVRVASPDEGERGLLSALDGTHTVAQLEERFGAGEVGEAIGQMWEMDLIEDAEDDERVPAGELERFDRQLRYFSDLGHTGGATPSECQARLREARVAVLGVGGLGGRTAWELACCGIGELWLIDGDRVEVSNLIRQIQYTEADLGRLKVEVTAARLRAFNSRMRVKTRAQRIEGQDQLAEFIAGADVVVDAADWPAHEIEYWVNSACFEAGIPYIAMSHFPPIARVGPLYVPGQTGCFKCQDIRYRREYPLYDVAIEQRRALRSPAATLGPACGLTGGLAAAEVMHLLTGLTSPAMLGVGHSIDLRTMEIERYEVVPEPECPVCSHLQPAAARMSSAEKLDDSARRTYDAFALAYDDFNHRYQYERWTGTLLAKAAEAGLRGDRLLDLGCGTGLSFIPMLGRGWRVTACDVSPAMLERARAKVGDAATLVEADMRELPKLGEFDLVWAVNDAVNYLLSTEELRAALEGMRRNLAPGGVALFDSNTLATYRTFFSTEQVVEVGGRRMVWRGQMSSEEVEPGSISEARFEAEGDPERTHVHCQRHFTEAEVLAAIDAAGLRCLDVTGEAEGVLEPGLDDLRHTKAVYVCGGSSPG